MQINIKALGKLKDLKNVVLIIIIVKFALIYELNDTSWITHIWITLANQKPAEHCADSGVSTLTLIHARRLPNLLRQTAKRHFSVLEVGEYDSITKKKPI